MQKRKKNVPLQEIIKSKRRQKVGQKLPYKKSYQKIINKISIVSLPINNYFKCQWTKVSVKRHRVTEWILKNRPSVYTRDFSFKIIHRLRS